MIIGIDASNIRYGGGLTHLKALLENVDPTENEIDKIVVWSSQNTLDQIPFRSFIEKVTHPRLNKSTFHTFLFQFCNLKTEAKNKKCDVIFAPGGTFISSFKPFVTMSQNMLPFQYEEAKHYNFKMLIRLGILFFTQKQTFKKANGLIFLTHYAQKYISKKIHLNKNKTIIIPHGVNQDFQLAPRTQLNEQEYNKSKLFQFLYVSYITIYKHQWQVAEAICQLHNEGLPIKIKLIGSILDSYEKIKAVETKYSNFNQCVEYINGLPHRDLIQYYQNSDAFIFASSCENMPIILIEAMSAGLPIASSNLGPMPEVLGDAGIYFDPRNINQIKKVIRFLFENKDKRIEYAQKAYLKTIDYTWKNCTKTTFDFLKKIAKNKN